jgi:hypothetical protein
MTQRLFSLSISTAMWSKVAMQKRYGVNLTDQERAGPEGLVRGRGAIGDPAIQVKRTTTACAD